MNMNQLIMNAYQHRNSSALLQIKETLEDQLEELNVFFDEYLDLFSDDMSATDEKDPMWIAYKDKLKEHSIVKQNLNIVEYYLRNF